MGASARGLRRDGQERRIAGSSGAVLKAADALRGRLREAPPREMRARMAEPAVEIVPERNILSLADETHIAGVAVARRADNLRFRALRIQAEFKEADRRGRCRIEAAKDSVRLLERLKLPPNLAAKRLSALMRLPMRRPIAPRRVDQGPFKFGERARDLASPIGAEETPVESA